MCPFDCHFLKAYGNKLSQTIDITNNFKKIQNKYLGSIHNTLDNAYGTRDNICHW